jgi:chromosome segregation ATPase
MCDCGWNARIEARISGLEGERDIARADAGEAERDKRSAEDRVRVLIKANLKIRGDLRDARTDLEVERATVARMESSIARLMADAVEKSRRLDALVARLQDFEDEVNGADQ